LILFSSIYKINGIILGLIHKELNVEKGQNVYGDYVPADFFTRGHQWLPIKINVS